jgi:hypothetical protein
MLLSFFDSRALMKRVAFGEVKRESAESGGEAVNAKARQREPSGIRHSLGLAKRYGAGGDRPGALFSEV